jgi:hypothetical protein
MISFIELGDRVLAMCCPPGDRLIKPVPIVLWRADIIAEVARRHQQPWLAAA